MILYTLYYIGTYSSGNDGKFWEVSEHVLNRIETPSYLAGRPVFSQYLEDNPWSARRKGINIFISHLKLSPT